MANNTISQDTLPPLDGSTLVVPLVVTVSDADAVQSETTISLNVNIGIYDPVEVPLKQAITNVLKTEIASRSNEFVDNERFLKTLLNFGNDTQRIITNWKLDPNDNTKLLIKLLSPLDFNYDVGNVAFISREVTDSIADTIKFELLPQPDTSLWLRPKNTEITTFVTDKELRSSRAVSGQTLSTIGINITGSEDQYGGYTFRDDLLRKWYTNDYRSVELNVDYTDYANFVTYSSAKLRLDAFKQKITKLTPSSRVILNLVISLFVTKNKFFFV